MIDHSVIECQWWFNGITTKVCQRSDDLLDFSVGYAGCDAIVVDTKHQHAPVGVVGHGHQVFRQTVFVG